MIKTRAVKGRWPLKGNKGLICASLLSIASVTPEGEQDPLSNICW